MNLSRWLKVCRLRFNIAKQNLWQLIFGKKLQAERDNEIHVNIDSKTVKRVDNTKSLGLIIDDRLS